MPQAPDSTNTPSPRSVKTAAALDASDVCKVLPLGRERIEILRDISLRIAHGELIAFSGSGVRGIAQDSDKRRSPWR